MPKTLPQKFFIKQDFSIAVIKPPEFFLTKQLIHLPNNTQLSLELTSAPYDIQIYFLKNKEEENCLLPAAKQAMKSAGYLWLCYPKGGIKAIFTTDLNRDSLWAIAVTHGLKAVHQISIDDTWSAVRFRIED
jgi:hypothetical protein